MTKIINLLGAPSSGKSVLRAYLYNRLKIESKLKIEEVTEFAKDLVYENPSLLEDQFYVTAEQHRRIRRLIGKVDIVINDSPIILGAIYNQTLPSIWNKFLAELYQQYDNITLLLTPQTFQQYGRIHNQSEVTNIHIKLMNFLYNNNIPFEKHTDNISTYNYIQKVINE